MLTNGSKMTTEDLVKYLREKFPVLGPMTRYRKSKFPSWFEWNYTDWSPGISVDTILQSNSGMDAHFELGANENTVLDECNVRVFEVRLTDFRTNPFKVSKDGWFVGIDYYIHVFTDKNDENVVCLFVQDKADWYVNLKGHRIAYTKKGPKRRKKE